MNTQDIYEELKYTAVNCWIETEDIPCLVKYILSSLEWRKELRNQIITKKSRIWAATAFLQLARINPRIKEILEQDIGEFMNIKTQQAKETYTTFVQSLDTDRESKRLLFDFLENLDSKLLIIPLYPTQEKLSCIALEHNSITRGCWVIERSIKTIQAFETNPQLLMISQWTITIKQDTAYIRAQIEKDPGNTNH